MNSRKNLIIFIIIITILALSAVLLFSRNTIATLFSFGITEEDSSGAIENDNPLVSDNGTSSVIVIPENDNSKPPVAENLSPQKSTILYTGRDPAEVRPVPEEVKVFTEEQRQQLYATIQTHANVVKSDPAYFNGWIQIGVLKKMIGDFEGARDAWEYASLIQPGNSLSYANLGELYWRYLHDYPNSEKNLLISIKNKPDDFQTHITLAELYYYSYTEKSALAEKVLLDGIAGNAENFSVKVNLIKALAALYRRQQEFSKAIAELQKVLAMEPGNPEVAATVEALQKKISP